VLGVFGQIGFIILVAVAVRTLGANFASNVDKLGETQFICSDGSFSYRCAYDFMATQAGFDISEAPLPYETTDSYWYAFYIGILNTLKVGLLGVFFVTILGTLAGIARLSKNWLISNIALWYVELMRNIPLLIVLFMIYFGAILQGPDLRESAQPFGLPIFLNNRGLNYPSFQLTSSAATWLAFVVLGIIQYQVLNILLSRREELTGKSISKFRWGLLSFLIVVAIGWFVSSALSDTQGLMATRASRIRQVDDIEQLMRNRTGVNMIGEIDDLPEEEIAAAALTVRLTIGGQLHIPNAAHGHSLQDHPL
jgi:general L-amino acid transport system permease protein